MIQDLLQSLWDYTKREYIVIIVALYALAMVIPPLPFSTGLYYVVLAAMFFYMVTRQGMRINMGICLFYLACILSIVMGHPDPIFKSWERLGLFILVTGAVFPLFASPEGDTFHLKLLSITLWLFVGVGVVSFFCYILGINYMRMWVKGQTSLMIAGAFGGITQHSMMLGPLSAFGAISIFTYIFFSDLEKVKKLILIALGGLCEISVLLSASRGAFIASLLGIIISLYFRYRGELGKFLNTIIIAVVVLAASFPLYSGYIQGLINKQNANIENGSSFASRDEKWNNRITEFESSPLFGIGFAAISRDTAEGMVTGRTGVVEPGSSWLGALSMLGIVGASILFALVIIPLTRLYKMIQREADISTPCLLFALLTANIVHQSVEGYALAGGSYLCFFFWLLLGSATIYTSKY